MEIKKSPIRELADKLGLEPIEDEIWFKDKSGKRFYPTKYGFITGTVHNGNILARENDKLKAKIKEQNEYIEKLTKKLERL